MENGAGSRLKLLKRYVDGGVIIAIATLIWSTSHFYYQIEQMKADIAACQQTIQEEQPLKTEIEVRLKVLEVHQGIGSSSDGSGL